MDALEVIVTDIDLLDSIKTNKYYLTSINLFNKFKQYVSDLRFEIRHVIYSEITLPQYLGFNNGRKD